MISAAQIENCFAAQALAQDAKGKKLQIAGGVLGIAGAIFYLAGIGESGIGIFLFVLGLAAILLSVPYILLTKTHRDNAALIYEVLSSRPRDMIWAYIVRESMNDIPVGTGAVICVRNPNKKLAIERKFLPDTDENTFLTALREFHPDIVLGYSSEAENAFTKTNYKL